MSRHAEHWKPFLDSGRMVVFGPVLEADESWGLGVVEADDEAALRAFAAADPAVTSGVAALRIGTTPGFARGAGDGAA